MVGFEAISNVDASALSMLKSLSKEMSQAQIRLLISGCNVAVRDLLECSGLFNEMLRAETLFVSLAEAVKHAARLHALRTGKADLPLAVECT